jgi:hypothetical protein
MILASVALAGCPDPRPDNGDAMPDAMSDAHDAADAMGDDAMPGDAMSPDGGSTECTLRRVLVTTSSGVEGGYILGNLTAPHDLQVVPAPAGTSVTQDHVVRTSGCFVFDLWRTFSASPNTLAVLDPDRLFTPVRTIALAPVPTGPEGALQSSNPYDVAVLSPTKAYVVQYNSPQVLIVNPSTGEISSQTISLADFADADGIPEAVSIDVVGERAYIALQQLDRGAGYVAPEHSVIAVIDTTTDRVLDMDPVTDGVQGIALRAGNPNSTAVSADGRYLLVSSTGNYGGMTDAALDTIDLSLTPPRVVRSLNVEALGGKPGSVETVQGTTAWVTVRRRSASVIASYDFISGDVATAPVAESDSVSFGGLRRDPNGNVWALNTAFGADGAVYAFRPDGTPLLSMPFTASETGTYSLDFVP